MGRQKIESIEVYVNIVDNKQLLLLKHLNLKYEWIDKQR